MAEFYTGEIRDGVVVFERSDDPTIRDLPTHERFSLEAGRNPKHNHSNAIRTCQDRSDEALERYTSRGTPIGIG